MTRHPRTLAEPQFDGDDGRADPRLVAAFGDDTDVLIAFAEVRVFVPIVPVLGEQATDGSDKSADMAALLMKGADGRQALLAFSSVARLNAFNEAARPVPLFGADAARAAVDEGAAAILLDLASDDFTVIESDDVSQLATGRRLIRTAQGAAWVVASPPTGFV